MMISTVLILISIGLDCKRVHGMCIRSSLMKPLYIENIYTCEWVGREKRMEFISMEFIYTNSTVTAIPVQYVFLSSRPLIQNP